MAQDLGDRRAESYGWGRLGTLYVEQQYALQGLDGTADNTDFMTEAKQATDRAMQLAQQIQAPDIAYRWQWQMGRLLRQQGQWDEAIAYYRQAFENLKALRSDLTVLDTNIQFSFREQIEPLYREFADLLLRSPALPTVAHGHYNPHHKSQRDGARTASYVLDTPHKPSEANLKQAREVLEALQLAELDNFFQDACSNVESASLDSIIDEQSPTSAVLYTIVLDETSSRQANQRIDLILKLPNDSLRYYSTTVNRTDVLQVALAFRRNLTTRPALKRPSQPLYQPSQTLYQWLIEPIETDLETHHIDHIVTVLDGVLRNVPIAALYDGQGFVGDRYAISVSPGLQLLKRDVLPRLSTRLLAAGLSEERAGFPPLPNVEAELDQINTVIPSSTQLLNQDFSESKLEATLKMKPTSILHLATHGQFSSQLNNTFLLAWDGKIQINELHELLRIQDQSQSNAIDLLVLSACQTAIGDERAALGLAGVAVRAGARSTLASLWTVDDQATALLVSEFYRQLYTSEQGMSKGEALRRAQKVVREWEFQGTRPYDHPRYWAAFVLLGNWM